MEGEAGTQIAFLPLALKRPSLERNTGWKSSEWQWNSVLFRAKRWEGEGKEADRESVPESSSGALPLGSHSAGMENKRKRSSDEEDEVSNLTLKLWGSSSSGDEKNPKTLKRHRSGFGPPSRPVCQVDRCDADLTSAKDYHRRHKVCELHSKASRAVVGNTLQRFCQQCSRFHPLEEFDEGKRSCRRRLAGHNRRRRKTQTEEAAAGFRIGSPADGSNASPKLDVASFVSALSQQLQRSDKKLFGRTIVDEENLFRTLMKMKNNSSTEATEMTGNHTSIDLNVSQPQPHIERLDGFPPDLDPDALRFLTAFTGNHLTSENLLQKDILSLQTPKKPSLQEKEAIPEHPVGPNIASPFGNKINCDVGKDKAFFPHSHINLLADHLPNLVPSKQSLRESTDCLAAKEKFSSGSSSSSPPVMHRLFPMHSVDKSKDNSSISVSEEDEISPFQSSGDCIKCQHNISRPSSQCDLRIRGYTSSGSDQSPVSSSSDAIERTNKIVIKLFDKDPSDFPEILRSQIFEWLSHCPTDMESYIRPGCVILTIFASMSAGAWEKLHRSMVECMKLLLNGTNRDFWRNGRFLVLAEKQMVLVRNGKVSFCKPCISVDAPEIRSVFPVAVVAGEETKFVVRGQNLTQPGTRFLFAYRGEYISEMVISGYNYQSNGSFLTNTTYIEHKVLGGSSSVLGRIFVEVERGFRGNSFPVIVANNAICAELRTLEANLQEDVRQPASSDNKQDSTQQEIVDFLNELGWLFQRLSVFGTDVPFTEVASPRFKFLLTYCVERGWIHLLRKILDTLFYMYGAGGGDNTEGALNVLSEIYLLHRAVKKNYRRVVDLLLCYVPSLNSRKGYVFKPDASGPGGLTPLHLAASIENAEEIVDALTNDPEKVGLAAWAKVKDDNQQTPELYALMANNHSYNRLVTNKLNARVSLTISSEISPAEGLNISRFTTHNSWPTLPEESLVCGQCSRLRTRKFSKFSGYYGAMYRPFVYSVFAVATVCATVCILFKAFITVGPGKQFKWENVQFGSL